MGELLPCSHSLGPTTEWGWAGLWRARGTGPRQRGLPGPHHAPGRLQSLFLLGKWVWLKARVDSPFVFRVHYGVLTASACMYMKSDHSHAFLDINTEGEGLEILIKLNKLIVLTVTIAV